MTCTKETVKPNGLNIWSSKNEDGPAPVVDIIMVQGLGAHPFYSWIKGAILEGQKTSKQRWEDSTAEVMWPRDILVPLFQDARIATYSYKSDWRDGTVKTSLRQCAEQFLNILSQHRQQSDEEKRPLVLIGHSLGCLVIQQALVIAIHQREFTNLRLSVAGIIFLGAPFQGSDAALFGTWLAKALRRDTALLELLKKDSPTLYDLSRDFWGSYSAWDLVCFYEMIDAEFGLIKTQVVSSQSATLPGKRMIFLNTDHSGLNKFSGEGDENFTLLLPEIQRMIRDGLSIVVDRHRVKDVGAASYGNVHWMVPRTINPLFTGRNELLHRIQEAIHYDSTSDLNKQKRFVITGLGGQGKSEICLQIANQMRKEFWGIFWVDVGMASTAESNFIAIAKLLGRSVENVSDALQVLATIKQNWLLILDNADDPNFDYQAYFPSGTHGAILMTSRVPECKGYSPEQFEALEASNISKQSWLSYDDQAETIVQLLASHTLALIQAGAYIAQGHCQLHQYPKIYQRQRKRLLQFRPKQAQSRYHDVYATFEASAEMLEQSKSEATEDALHLLAVLSILDSAILPCQIFEEAWNNSKLIITESEELNEIDDLSRNHILRLPSFLVVEGDNWDSFRFTEASSQLVSLSLVIQHNADGLLGLSMHPLAHAWAKDRQDPKQQGIAWIAAGCILILSRQNSTLWKTQEKQLLPHIQSYLDIKIGKVFSFEDKSIIIPILLQCSRILLNMRQDTRLSHLLEDIYIGINKNPKEPSKESLPLYDLQARSLLNTGKNKKAVALLEQVVKIRETIQAEDHPDRLASQHVLAMAYEANGQIKEAVALLEQVVKIRETIQAEDHPDRLASQHVLARTYQANGQVKEAVALLEQVVIIEEITLAEDHPDRLASQYELARAYRANGQIKEAIALLEQVVKIREITLIEDHPDRLALQHELAYRLASQYELAYAYQANGQVKEAIVLFKQVVRIKRVKFQMEHPSRIASEKWLSYLLKQT
ncbi:phosphorylase superfamily protein [Botrytis cinerea]